MFRNEIGKNTFQHKYAMSPNDTWENLAIRLVEDVCGKGSEGKLPAIMSEAQRKKLTKYIKDMKFIPGGRYLYYAGREFKAFNNCYLLKGEEDTREEWARLAGKAMSFLTTGGGIGIDYSVFRPAGRLLSRTGGLSSGPIPLMKAINEIGRNVMQGGSRRSAIYASLNWQHDDIEAYLTAKDWDVEVYPGVTLKDIKDKDFNYPAPLDMTNISVNYDNAFLEAIKGGELPNVYIKNVEQALKTGEPGFSFNFFDKEGETLRNACTEVTSDTDSDVCNLGSVNMGNIESIEEFKDVVSLASKFLVCGTLRADLPDDDVKKVREENRRIGLGIMGVHEWLLKRKYIYQMNDELRSWLEIYRDESEASANEHCDRFYLNRPVAYRAIAPTGSIGILAGTTTGIEPLYAVAYKRRYLKNGTDWHYEYVIDTTAKELIDKYNINPEDIETSLSLASDPERRIKFQADVQDYVDMAISSTINLPPFEEQSVSIMEFAEMLAEYAPRLRGFTCYPDGSRGGQPLTMVDYYEALEHEGTVFLENDICTLSGKGGTCGS